MVRVARRGSRIKGLEAGQSKAWPESCPPPVFVQPVSSELFRIFKLLKKSQKNNIL